MLKATESRVAYLESYRHLRSALLLSPKENARSPQTLLVTSSVPHEGKTTVAVNLARILARSGFRVVLVDADSHGGGLHGLMGMQDRPGLWDYFQGAAAAGGIVQLTDDPGLSIVPRGNPVNYREGLFLRSGNERLLKELRADFDFVILDGPPVLLADDSALLASHADAVILIARPFFTKARLLRQSLDMLYQRKTKLVFTVLNCARPDDCAGYLKQSGRQSSVAKNGIKGLA